MASMSPFFPAHQLFPGGIEAVLPVWLTANLDEDVAAHELLDLQGQLPFVSLHRRIADPEGFSNIPERPAFDDAANDSSLSLC